MKNIQEHGFWKTFAVLTRGTFTEGKYGKSDKVEINYKKWTISFDDHTFRNTTGDFSLEEAYTRVTVLINSRDDFRFEIYPKTTLDSILQILGRRKIQLGIPEFDKSYFIKSNNEIKIKQILEDDSLRLMIQHYDKSHLQISDREGIWGDLIPSGQLELSFYSEGAIREIEKLEYIRQIVQKTLDSL